MKPDVWNYYSQYPDIHGEKCEGGCVQAWYEGGEPEELELESLVEPEGLEMWLDGGNGMKWEMDVGYLLERQPRGWQQRFQR